ncbi:putative reverse transcriptase domain-containing protein [Tanacetum coccineum]
MASSRRSGNNDNNNNESLDIAAIIAQQLQAILPQIVTQVTNNVNNANNGNRGNGGNNRCTFKAFQSCNPKEYDGKGGAIVLTRWIEKMENVIDNSGCAENQKVRGGEAAIAMTWNDFKALMVEEFCPSNEMEKLENEFWNHKMVGANHAAYTDRFHELAKLVPHLVTPESSRIKRYIARLALEIRGMLRATQPTTIQNAILRAGILTDEAISYDNKKAKTGTGFVTTSPPRNEIASSSSKDCRAPVRQVASVNTVGMSNNSRVCYDRNNRSNRNQVRGRDFNVNVNAMEAVQDPNVVMGMFYLNDHFVTVLFDFGSDFSFISTKFVPLLNVKPSIVNPGYVIEVVDGYGSFDVIVGMDWLSQHKAVIVCHEKVVEIPVEDGRILRVHEEWTVGITKALKSAKEDEPKLSDLSVVREFEDVFPEDLSGLPPQ